MIKYFITPYSEYLILSAKILVLLFLTLTGHFTMKKPTVRFTKFICEKKCSLHGLEKQSLPRYLSTIANNIENVNIETTFAMWDACYKDQVLCH